MSKPTRKSSVQPAVEAAPAATSGEAAAPAPAAAEKPAEVAEVASTDAVQPLKPVVVPVAASVAPPAIRAPLPGWAIAAGFVLAAGAGWLAANSAQIPAFQAERTEAIARFDAMSHALTRLSADLEGLKESTSALAAYPRPQAVSLAPLVNKLDAAREAAERSQKDLTERLAVLSGRTEKIERSMTSLATGSVTAPKVATATTQPLPPKPAEASAKVLEGWLLRDVYDGIAIVEDRRGIIHEVMRGETIPGAGRVQKMERRAGNWMLVTEKGTIAAR